MTCPEMQKECVLENELEIGNSWLSVLNSYLLMLNLSAVLGRSAAGLLSQKCAVVFCFVIFFFF